MMPTFFKNLEGKLSSQKNEDLWQREANQTIMNIKPLNQEDLKFLIHKLCSHRNIINRPLKEISTIRIIILLTQEM